MSVLYEITFEHINFSRCGVMHLRHNAPSTYLRLRLLELNVVVALTLSTTIGIRTMIVAVIKKLFPRSRFLEYARRNSCLFTS